jgi:SP family general alpha glucoside:H+ symporter-like MFS transporter
MASDVLTVEDVGPPRRKSKSLQPTQTVIHQISVVNGDLPHLLNEANNATNAEKTMSIHEAIKTYPKAVIFSIILSTAIVMESYDGSCSQCLSYYRLFQE